jgi:hypothetical protein
MKHTEGEWKIRKTKQVPLIYKAGTQEFQNWIDEAYTNELREEALWNAADGMTTEEAERILKGDVPLATQIPEGMSPEEAERLLRYGREMEVIAREIISLISPYSIKKNNPDRACHLLREMISKLNGEGK